MIYRTYPLPRLRIPAPADALDRLSGEGFVLARREGYGPGARKGLKHEQAEARMFKWPKTLDERYLHPLLRKGQEIALLRHLWEVQHMRL